LDLIAWIDDNVGKEFRTKFGQSIEFDRHFLEKYFKTNTASSSSSSLKDRLVKKTAKQTGIQSTDCIESFFMIAHLSSNQGDKIRQIFNSWVIFYEN
jgi:hypothetical protein